MRSVPPSVKNTAWIDRDLIFARSDWMDEAKKKLKTFNIIQLYSEFLDVNSDDHQTDYPDALYQDTVSLA